MVVERGTCTCHRVLMWVRNPQRLLGWGPFVSDEVQEGSLLM